MKNNYGNGMVGKIVMNLANKDICCIMDALAFFVNIKRTLQPLQLKYAQVPLIKMTLLSMSNCQKVSITRLVSQLNVLYSLFVYPSKQKTFYMYFLGGNPGPYV